MKYLLDTNAWIALLRGKNAHVMSQVQRHSADIRFCSVVLGELHYGAHHSGPANVAANLTLLVGLRARFPSLPYDDSAAERYGELREQLASQGMVIGPNDLLIAAIALAHGLTLVTHNTAEFSRVPGLPLEDWQVP